MVQYEREPLEPLLNFIPFCVVELGDTKLSNAPFAFKVPITINEEPLLKVKLEQFVRVKIIFAGIVKSPITIIFPSKVWLCDNVPDIV